MLGKQHRAKFHPFRMLTMLLWHDYGFAQWNGDTVTVLPGGLSRVLRVGRSRVFEYLQWLEAKGYLKDVRQDGKKFVFTVTKPGRWAA
jgi:hypothetical protein